MIFLKRSAIAAVLIAIALVPVAYWHWKRNELMSEFAKNQPDEINLRIQHGEREIGRLRSDTERIAKELKN